MKTSKKQQYKLPEALLLMPQWGMNRSGEWIVDALYHYGVEYIGTRKMECLCDNNNNPDSEEASKPDIQDSSSKVDRP